MTDNTEALPPHPSHATVRDWMPVAEALRLADLWTVGDLDNSGQWRAAIKVLADEVRAALTAAPSAQAEPDDEPRFTAGGGFPGDHNGEKAAQAEPQVPRSVIDQSWLDNKGKVLDAMRAAGLMLVNRGTHFEVIDHPCGKQEGK